MSNKLKEVVRKLNDLPTTIIMVPVDENTHITQVCVDKHKVMEILTGAKTS